MEYPRVINQFMDADVLAFLLLHYLGFRVPIAADDTSHFNLVLNDARFKAAEIALVVLARSTMV